MKSDDNKKYGSLKIPPRQQIYNDEADNLLSHQKNKADDSLSDGLFYEVEYNVSPTTSVDIPVSRSQKIEPPEKDEIRELFYEMRDIARQYRSPFGYYPQFFDRRMQQYNAKVFYEQAAFMKDFEDDYPEQVTFSSYFPYYQMLGYKQLRTYFTWRTNVRKGNISNISLSYAFLYIYELLNNIGVTDPQDGLNKLLYFWTSFRNYDTSVDRYVLRWLKDYHIYYELSQTFKEFVDEQGLTEHYPELSTTENSFDFFCNISKYDIRKSKFFTAETSKLITECFNFVMDKVRHDFETAGMHFDDAFFRPKRMITWIPFKDALFYQWINQPDRKVIISESEIYICSNNQWTYSTSITTEKGRQFIGYVMKQMESVLRKITKYKFKITANIYMMDHETVNKLQKNGLYIDRIVQSAVAEFYKEITKVVVTVNSDSLARIRQESLKTQESLIVEDQTESSNSPTFNVTQSLPDENIFADINDTEPSPLSDSWTSLKYALTDIESLALAEILSGGNIKKFADGHNIMLEVLADGINEKATDCIGDNILDDEFAVYEDYENQVKGMIE